MTNTIAKRVPIAMKGSAITVLCLFAALSSAQGDPTKDKLVLQTAQMSRVSVKKDILYKQSERPLKFDLYTPSIDSKNLPTVIFINGIGDGAGRAPLKEWGQYRDWAKLIASSGMAAITFSDRPEHVSEDIADLLDFVSKGNVGPAVDPNNLCMWACSANVRLSYPILMEESRKYLKCGIFYYGVPQSEAVRTDIPILLVRAGFDSENLNGGLEAAVQKLQQNNAPVTLINLAGAQHAFDLADDNDISRDTIRQTVSFIKNGLNPKFQRELANTQVARDGLRALRAHDYARAEELYRQAIRSKPDEPMHRMNHGIALVNLKRYEEAAAEFEALVETGFQPRSAYYNAAGANALAGKRDKALAQLGEALKRGYPKDQARNDPQFVSLKDDEGFKTLVG